MIAGPASKNIPTINNKIFIKNKRIYGLSLKLSTKSAKCSGACERLTTVLKAIAAPTKSKTTDDTNAALVKTFGISRHSRVFNTNKPIKKA